MNCTDVNCTETKCQRREAQNCESFLKKKVPDLKVSASGIESQRCTPSRMHLVKFLKKVNFLSICIIMAFCFLLLLNPFVFGAVTLFHVQLLVSFAMILTSAVVSIFYHTWCSVVCLNEAILNACNDCGQFEKDSSVSVVVNVENKESIKDWQLQSCCAKLVYCECLKGCRHVVLRDGEVSSVSAKQLKGALQENIFENEAQPCVIVDIDNKESVDDLQFRSRYAKFVYCKSVRRRHQRDREPSRIPVKQLSRALHKSRHFRKLFYMFVRPRSAVKKRSMKRKWCTAHQRKKPKSCGRRVKVKCNYTSVRSVYKDVDHRMNHTEFKLCNDIEKNPGPFDHT